MSTTWDTLQEYRSLGERLNEFLYNGKVKQGEKKEHTKEELEEMLENIRKECWDNYSELKEELG